MKVKDLKDVELVGIKVKIPKKFEDLYQGIKGEMYVCSYWQAGVWFKKSMKESKIYPLCMEPKELLNFTVVKEQ
jgi:hypothetical protein